ncbi:threonine/homoserine efflux transporter RhtA [Amycolatopsis echigonensis]|uniref:Threonine/homoserine efflux transporter RhtA n=2 Tax=Amycolatopsis echigonensis TaxID=2576905 RepID=A0A2N3WV57_9PSEU|nr:threonine/homoserine efflux transporter RhtA [Amycolatopsis niigatensis]
MSLIVSDPTIEGMTTESAPLPTAGPIAALTGRADPRLLAAAGCLCIALTSVLIKVSGASGATSAFWRCALALPLLAVLAFSEARRTRVRAKILLPLLAGLGLGLDFVLWGEAIPRVGAGVATMLLSVQVVIVPLLAFVFLKERPDPRFKFVAPTLIGGIVLAGGVFGSSTTGSNPVLGLVFALAAGAGYSGYLLLLRLSSSPATQVRSLSLATVSAGFVSVVLGLPFGRLDLAPSLPSLGWFAALAIVGQVVGWLLIAGALPRLAASTGATMMLLQPVGAVAFGFLLLSERPGALQLVGCVIVLAAVCFAGRGAAKKPAVQSSARLSPTASSSPRAMSLNSSRR